MDNNKILEKVKVKIAISNVKEEDIVMNKNRFNAIKKIGIVACAALSMTSSHGVQTAINNSYYSDVNTEYKEANGISANIESFLLDDYNFDITINIKFDETYNLANMLSKEGKIDIMDLKVVNENNEKDKKNYLKLVLKSNDRSQRELDSMMNKGFIEVTYLCLKTYINL